MKLRRCISATSRRLNVERAFYLYWVGQNKRYGAANVDRWLDNWAMREEPMLLTAVEVDLAHDPERTFPEPRRVHVWIRYPSRAVRVMAHAVAWNTRAVKVRFLEPMIKTEREGWVWTNAVRPDPPMNRSNG